MITPADIHITYLATPYSHPNPAEETRRARMAAWAAIVLGRSAGIEVYSPIVEGHALREAARANGVDLAGDWTAWAARDVRMLLAFDSLTVAMIDGWDRSRGIRKEMAAALLGGKPIRFCSAYGDPVDPPERFAHFASRWGRL